MFPEAGPNGEALANLGYIIKDRGLFQLDICADPSPDNLAAEFAGNRESPARSIDISWDGQWHDDAETMQTHLILEVRGQA